MGLLPRSDPDLDVFAGRNVLYERFFAGHPWRLGVLAATQYPLQDELKQRVWAFLGRTREWDARLGGTAGPGP